MKKGNLVRRDPERWEYLTSEELAETGVVIEMETEMSHIHAVVHWPDGLSWEDPEELEVIDEMGN